MTVFLFFLNPAPEFILFMNSMNLGLVASACGETFLMARRSLAPSKSVAMSKLSFLFLVVREPS